VKQDWQGTPYVDYDCPDCGSTLSGPPSRLPRLQHQHRERCRLASPADRQVRRDTGRWPPLHTPARNRRQTKKTT